MSGRDDGITIPSMPVRMGVPGGAGGVGVVNCRVVNHEQLGMVFSRAAAIRSSMEGARNSTPAERQAADIANYMPSRHHLTVQAEKDAAARTSHYVAATLRAIYAEAVARPGTPSWFRRLVAERMGALR